jgi:HD-like signal output (HDOD) protein
VLTSCVIEIRTERSSFAERTFQPELVDDLPDVPVLPETLLLMDLKIHEFSVDLHEMSQLVLSDLGATLQILRLAAREYGDANDRPSRIEDCISALGLQACLKAAFRSTIGTHTRHRTVIETWVHSREVAQHAKSLAEETTGSIRPDHAWMAGLLHALPLLPGVLGWTYREPGVAAATGLRLAERWRLPHYIHEFFREMHFHGHESQWTSLVQTAHEMARRSPMDCPLYKTLTPKLHRRA